MALIVAIAPRAPAATPGLISQVSDLIRASQSALFQQLPDRALFVVLHARPVGDFIEGAKAAFAQAGGRAHATHAGARAGDGGDEFGH
jgi:hypothetical protein